jgi:hypothetical protein
MMIDEGKVMSYVRRMKVCILEGYWVWQRFFTDDGGRDFSKENPA